jgi:hypothetical protein
MSFQVSYAKHFRVSDWARNSDVREKEQIPKYGEETSW